MFKVSNKIIIVDDQQKELDILSQAFLDNGIGCRPLLYNNAYFEPLSDIRIAFFDLNIGEKQVDDSGKTPEEVEKLNSGVYNDLAIAINQYIAKDNGPFALIFWTKKKQIIDGFVNYMQNPERGFSESPFPIVIDCIDKDEFINANNENNLSQKLLEVLNLEQIKFLFNFETKAIEAAEKTINRLYEIIPKDANWGENKILFDNLGKILSKIAASTLGFEHSKENPNKAVYEGLLPILNSELINSDSEVNWELILAPLYAGKIVSPDDIIQRKVNSVFHIEPLDRDKGKRGSVIELEKFDKTVLESLNIYDMNEWFDKLFPFKTNAIGLVKKRFIRRFSKLIAIELSAACDYSNQKPRINKYVLGFLTPCFDTKNDIASSQRIESSYHLGGCDFHMEGCDFQIWLNLNFVFGAKSEDPRFGESLFILKKEIMDMLGNKYASHVSRIGITSL
jgi:hypothetical protein